MFRFDRNTIMRDKLLLLYSLSAVGWEKARIYTHGNKLKTDGEILDFSIIFDVFGKTRN